MKVCCINEGLASGVHSPRACESLLNGPAVRAHSPHPTPPHQNTLPESFTLPFFLLWFSSLHLRPLDTVSAASSLVHGPPRPTGAHWNVRG